MMVVSELPRWWTLPLRVRWSKLVMSSGSGSGGSGNCAELFGVVGMVVILGLLALTGLYAKSRKAMYAIALARCHLWLAPEDVSLSAADPDIQELPVALYYPLADSLVYAA